MITAATEHMTDECSVYVHSDGVLADVEIYVPTVARADAVIEAADEAFPELTYLRSYRHGREQMIILFRAADLDVDAVDLAARVDAITDALPGQVGSPTGPRF